MRKKLFIVEDNANILYGLQAKFSVAGFEVAINSGNESEPGIAGKIIAARPDYLILDLILPKADGFKILSALKAPGGLPGLPVFAFTDLGDKESREKGLKLGISHYLIKNELNVDEFVEKVVKIISNLEKK
ncbi:MAG: response regulator [Patescibacteria group bacterium]|jgi:DNA-binding response OmpR family regulator